MYSPNTEFLKTLSEKLKATGIDVYFKLPAPEVMEPFFVIANRMDDDSMTARTGGLIVRTKQQIDLFYPIKSRTNLEEIIYKTKISLGRNQNLTSDIRIDDSVGREIYHVIFMLSELIT